MQSTDKISSAAGSLSCLWDMAGQYLLLAKPRIVLLVIITGAGAMVLEGSLLGRPWRFAAVLSGIMLAAAAANALNNFWDRDIDAVMNRTRSKRPIPAGRIAPGSALCFGLVTAMVSLFLLQIAGNRLAAALGAGAIIIYVLIYTMWLKRRTSLNIVIGGASGATAPLIGWAAGADGLSAVPLLMFIVVFLWTPPHFWALALFTKQDYARVGIPMLPVVAGDRTTRRQISVYMVLLLPTITCLGIIADLGPAFLVGTTLLGIVFIHKLVMLYRYQNDRSARAFFHYSIIYLAVVFILMPALQG